MSSEISDLKVSIEIFNEFSRNEFLRRYHEYFQTNIDPEYRPVFTVRSNWFNDKAKIQFSSMSLNEQYAFIYRVVRNEMFESAKNIYIEGKKDKTIYYDGNNPNRPTTKSFNLKKMKIEESVTEDNIMRLTLLIDEGHEYLKEKDKNDNYWK
jgi:hypothetical protein